MMNDILDWARYFSEQIIVGLFSERFSYFHWETQKTMSTKNIFGILLFAKKS